MDSFYNNKNVLVTGAAGLTGHSMVHHLLFQGAYVLAIVFNNRTLDIIHPRLTVKKMDLSCYDDCLAATNSMDIVFNCVAFIRGAGGQKAQPTEIIRHNLIPTMNMIEASVKSGVERFGFLSSSTVYPDISYPATEGLGFVGDPADCYYGVGWMKRYCEKLCTYFHDNSKTAFSIVRTTALYGPHDNFSPEQGHVIPSLIIKAYRKDNPFEIWGDGTQTRDFVYIDDLTEAFATVVRDHPKPEPLNVATGKGSTINDIARALFDASGYSPDVVYDTSKPTMIPKRLVDVYKANQMGIECKTSIQDGLHKTFEWYKNQNSLNS